MGFLKSFGVLIAIPLFGFFVYYLITLDVSRGFKEAGLDYSIAEFCGSKAPELNNDLKFICSSLTRFEWLKLVSIFSVIFSIFLLCSFTVLSSIIGQNRVKITKVFPPLVSITVIFLIIQVIVQSAILLYGIYRLQAYAFGEVYAPVIGIVVIITLLAGNSLITTLFQLLKKQTQYISGLHLIKSEHPKLFNIVRELATDLRVEEPKNIVLGLDQPFYITHANIELKTSKCTLNGCTLFLSLPLMQTLTIDEMKAIISHELSHFQCEYDSFFSKFSLVHSSLIHSVNAMNVKSLDGLTTLPAFYVFSYLLDVFQVNVDAVGHELEFKVDNATTKVVDAKILINALLKNGVYYKAWAKLEHKMLERMEDGKETRNMPKIFSHFVQLVTADNELSQVIESIAAEPILHPHNSHPATIERIENLGIKINDIQRDVLKIPEKSAVSIFGNLDSVEEDLTMLLQDHCSYFGVYVAHNEGTFETLTSILTAFGAHIALVTGKADSDEVDSVASVGISSDSEFDYIEFYQYCFYPELLPDLKDLLKVSKELQSDDKSEILEYLDSIAMLYSEVRIDKNEILDTIRSELDA